MTQTLLSGWDIDDACPICKRPWRHKTCPHSFEEAARHAEEDAIRRIVRDEHARIVHPDG